MNNYLDFVVSELKNFPQNNSQVLNLIQSKKNVFNRFKREFIKNINSIKDNDLIAFALLICARNTDFDFHQILSKHFNFNNINTPLANFAKGIHGSRSGQNFAAFNLLWQCYKHNPLYFTPLDCILLIQLAKEFNFQTERKIIIDNLIQQFPDNIDYRFQLIYFFIYNNYNSELQQQIKYVHNNINASIHWCHLANIYFEIGDINNFFKCSEKAYTAEDFPSCNYIFVNNEKSKFPAIDCLEHMNNLLDFLDANNIKAFPEGGSLLGLYRDGKLMDYDKDTDIGIIVNDNDDVIKIINTISTNKSFICQEVNKSNLSRKILNLSVTNKRNGAVTDIFFFYKNYYNYNKYHPRYNYLYTGISTTLLDRLVEFKPFKIVKTNLAGRVYNVPENIEEYLSQEYGENWNEHISVWDSLINCPNITPESKLVVYYYGSIRMHEALRQHKYAKALNYYTTLKNRWEYPFTAEMINKIENYLEKIEPK